MAGDAVKEAADNVRRLGRYLTHPVLIRREELNGGRSCGDRRQIDPAEVISLPDIHCLEDAMAHVLERLSDPSYLEGLDLHSTEKISSNRSYRAETDAREIRPSSVLRGTYKAKRVYSFHSKSAMSQISARAYRVVN